MGGVQVTRNFDPLDTIDLLTQDDWRTVGLLARERLIARTLQGKDEDEASFAPYSAAYAAQRAKIGASTSPNLQLSGGMLNAITVEADSDGVTLAFSS